MSRILFQESYIVIVPSFDKTATHKHPFLHLFSGQNKCKIKTDKKELQGNIILIDSNNRHAVEPGNDCDFFLLIDPTSAIAEQMKEQYIKEGFSDYIPKPINPDVLEAAIARFLQ